MVHGRALKLAAACAVTISAISAVTSAVVVAGASGPGTTYYACLKSGKLTAVGTTPPTCKSGATVISWNSQGPAGPPGASGAPGSVGPQGPAGPGPVYIAENSNGTLTKSIDTPDLLAADVNGFSVHLSCQANFTDDTAAVQATLTSTDPSIQSVGIYESSFDPGGNPYAGSYSGSQLRSPADIAIIDNINPGSPADMFTQGYVVANSGGIASQPGGATGNCAVTGTLVPITGKRTVPLPIFVG
jgi:hypothetical protein